MFVYVKQHTYYLKTRQKWKQVQGKHSVELRSSFSPLCLKIRGSNYNFTPSNVFGVIWFPKDGAPSLFLSLLSASSANLFLLFNLFCPKWVIFHFHINLLAAVFFLMNRRSGEEKHGPTVLWQIFLNFVSIRSTLELLKNSATFSTAPTPNAHLHQV